MDTNTPTIPAILRGDSGSLEQALAETTGSGVRKRLAIAISACALYGATLGVWQGGMMPLYTAVKIPLVILLTLAANGFLNGVLSLLLGSGLGIKKTLNAQLTAFMVAALILASLSPITFFLARNLANPQDPGGEHAHAVFLLTHTVLIGFAGLVANAKLFDLLRLNAPNLNTARATYLAWLGGNLLAGAQLTYIFRPYFGNPAKPIEFLRPNPFDGSFAEVVWKSFEQLLPEVATAPRAILLITLLIIGIGFSLPKALFNNSNPSKS